MALETLGENGAVFLPYSLDDESVECVEATRIGEEIVLRCVNVATNGYSLALDDLSDFMLSRQELVEFRYPAIFGQYDRQEIISSMRNRDHSALRTAPAGEATWL